MAGDFPDDLRYTETDEWVRRDGDELVVGITKYASEQLGDVVYVQPPEVGKHFTKGESYGEIESVKAVSDLYSPLSGQISGVNEELDQNPALVNDDPYGRGWIARMRTDNATDFETLLDSAAYEASTRERH